MKTRVINIDELREVYLPHRYPFIFLDRVLSFTEDSIVGVKNVTINENFFQGHFPSYPILPGVIIIESLAQLSGVLAKLIYVNRGNDNSPVKDSFFTSLDNSKFKAQVRPGDVLTLESKYVKDKMNLWYFDCKATVDGKVACLTSMSLYMST